MENLEKVIGERGNRTIILAREYEKDGMDFGNAIRLANLQTLSSVTELSETEEKGLNQLKEKLNTLRNKK